MRTRTRSSLSSYAPAMSSMVVTTTMTDCTGAKYVSSSTYPSTSAVPLKGSDEVMMDSLGKGAPHSVKHRKMSYDISDAPMSAGRPYPSPPYGVTKSIPDTGLRDALNYNSIWDNDIKNWALSGLMLDSPPGWTFETISSPDSVIINDLLDRAKGLKADVLLNIVEANQAWPAVKSLATALPNMAKHWGSITKQIKNVSGAYLAWKFGVSPILSDITTINRNLPSIGKQFQHAIKSTSQRYSREFVTRATFGLTHPPTIANGFEVLRFGFQGLTLETPKVTYVLVVRPTIKYQTEVFQNLDQIMKRFSSSPASLAWEKIPFSFMVDWFVDMRGTLNKLDAAIGFQPFAVVSLTKSRTYHVATDMFVQWNTPCSGAPLYDVRASHREYKHYERSVLSQPSIKPVVNARFGKNQAAITAALIAQKLSSLRTIGR